MSPSSVERVRVYCSITMVSLPSVTTNAPRSVCAASGAAARDRTASGRTAIRMTVLPVGVEGGRALLHPHRLQCIVPLDRVDNVHSPGDLSENGVDAVQMPLRRMADEELAAPGVLAGVRHREGAGDVLVDVAVRLALDRVAGPARADGPLAGLRIWVAALDHEVGDDAMEFGAVVEPGIGELLEVGDGVGGLVGVQLELDRPLAGLHHGGLVGHQVSTVKFSSACATVLVPTIAVETAALSSTNFSASWAGLDPVCAARSRTRWPSAASLATCCCGMRARMSPLSQVLWGV